MLYSLRLCTFLQTWTALYQNKILIEYANPQVLIDMIKRIYIEDEMLDMVDKIEIAEQFPEVSVGEGDTFDIVSNYEVLYS